MIQHNGKVFAHLFKVAMQERPDGFHYVIMRIDTKMQIVSIRGWGTREEARAVAEIGIMNMSAALVNEKFVVN